MKRPDVTEMTERQWEDFREAHPYEWRDYAEVRYAYEKGINKESRKACWIILAALLWGLFLGIVSD